MPVKIVPSGPRGFADDPRELYLSVWDDSTKAFGRLFQLNGGSSISTPQQSFLWTELRDLVDRANYDFPGIAVFYGIANSELRYGIGVLDMRPIVDATGQRTGYSFPLLTEPEYILEDNDFIDASTRSWANWAATYWNDVQVDLRNNGQFVNVKDWGGARAVIFPWREELLAMYTGNCPSAMCTGFRVMLSSLSMDHGTVVEEFKHGVSFHLEEKRGFPRKWHPFMDNDNWAVLYMNKGADFGNLCPPSCDTYTAPAS